MGVAGYFKIDIRLLMRLFFLPKQYQHQEIGKKHRHEKKVNFELNCFDIFLIFQMFNSHFSVYLSKGIAEQETPTLNTGLKNSCN